MKTKLKAVRRAKSLAAAGLLAAGLGLIGSNAQAAYLIGPTDVGSLDTVIGAVDSPNSGLSTEEQLLEAACGCNVTLIENVDNPAEVTVGTDHYIDVSPAGPTYYVLKFGTGNTGNDMFFMLNEQFLQYLAWSDAQLIAAGLPADHVQSLSHYAITTGGGTVSEPGTLALAGIALLAASATRRRKQ